MVSQSAKKQKRSPKMSKRGRPRTRTTSGQERPSVARPIKHVDQDRESADRIAAAEAMSALSSLVILPTNSSDISGLDSVEIKTEIDEESDDTTVIRPREAKQTGAGVPKRGKPRSRGRGGRREIPRTHVDLIANQKNEKSETRASKRGRAKNSNNSNKQVTQPSPTKNNATLIAANLNKMVQQNLETQNKALKKEESSIHTHKSPNTFSIHPSVKTSLHHLIQLRQLGIDPSKLQTEQLGKGGDQSTENTGEALNCSFLKLPLTIAASSSREKPDRKCVSPSSTTSNDSIELTQSAVDSILLAGAKHDTTHEASLPLKKRRLQTYQDGEEEAKVGHTNMVDLSNEPDMHTAGVPVTSTTEETSSVKESTTSTTRGPPGLTLAQSVDANPSGEIKSGINVDPHTSLMLLNEVQMALRQDEDGDLPLHIAVVHENIVMVQKFVHLMSITGKSVDKYNKAQQTPLHLAVELKFDEAVKVLLLAGANPNLVNRHGECAVHMAVKQGSVQCLYLLLVKSHHKLDVNCRDFQGLCPLHVAVIKKYMQSVKLLLKAGADINMQDGKSGRTSLFYAVEAENIEMVRFLQDSGANVEMTNYAGITAIMTAQARGYSAIAGMLLRGLDTKSYLEHKEKEKVFIPKEKKMPLPRIPSKSHLIVPESSAKAPKQEYTLEPPTSSPVTMGTEDDAEVQVVVEPERGQLQVTPQQPQDDFFQGSKFKVYNAGGNTTIIYYTTPSGRDVIVGRILNGSQFIGVPEYLVALQAAAKVNSQSEKSMEVHPTVTNLNLQSEKEEGVSVSQVKGHTVHQTSEEVIDLSNSADSNQKLNYKTNRHMHDIAANGRNISSLQRHSSTDDSASVSNLPYSTAAVISSSQPNTAIDTVTHTVTDINVSSMPRKPAANDASLSTNPKQTTALNINSSNNVANVTNNDAANISILQQRAAFLSSLLRNSAVMTNNQIHPMLDFLKAPDKPNNSSASGVKVESEPQVGQLYNRGSLVTDRDEESYHQISDVHEGESFDSAQTEKMENSGKHKAGKERKNYKKEKSISVGKNKMKELKKDDKTGSRSKSPTIRTDGNAKMREGIGAKSASQTFGNITNITASVALSLQAKLLGMMSNRPLNLTTTDRNVSEESKTKEMPVTSS